MNINGYLDGNIVHCHVWDMTQQNLDVNKQFIGDADQSNITKRRKKWNYV